MEKPEEIDYDPICPHCDQEVQHLKIHHSEASSFLGLKLNARLGVFSCPSCRRILGMASRAYGEK